jgi:hypothetical protein
MNDQVPDLSQPYDPEGQQPILYSLLCSLCFLGCRNSINCRRYPTLYYKRGFAINDFAVL